jgi:hypothetical protein
MVQWAATNLGEEQKAAFNAALDSGDLGRVMFAVQGLRAQHQQAAGTQPTLLKGSPNGTSAIQPFASSAQVTEAMNDPRYKKDPAFRQMVYDRLAQSNVL